MCNIIEYAQTCSVVHAVCASGISIVTRLRGLPRCVCIWQLDRLTVPNWLF